MSFWGASAATNLTHVSWAERMNRNAKCLSFRAVPCSTLRNELEPSHGALQHFGEVGLLPREPAFIVRRPAEMTVGRGPRLDRPVEIEMLEDARGGQVPLFGHPLLKLVLGPAAGAVGVDVDRQRPRHADRVS